ncbi:uncharacterized protein GGS22DRAFT_112534 [Annulohypoxylon maeteangense]|uniref:uncharacterized protein n=1 Tax=Annulohypoxylon maeteangense TaxID=1927788 RepID=UPI002007CB3F|nr:uncharacterized protein GGS22DRAFT_112534 [Annulohypoxylon maeteangense]KAI0887654.1 hypothetical protein GGS22DRAFT_112534 [Annulohypoxylon maeteangense]
MTRAFQFGLAVEAFLNIVGAVPFVLYPEWCLSFAVANRSATGAPDVPPSSAVLWQIYGVLVLSLTVPLVLCIPDSNAVADKRRIVFQTLIAGEVLIEAILLRHISQPEKSGFTLTSLLLSAFFLLPALFWHTFATYVKPDLMSSDRFPSAKPAKKTR